jgi:hypothetical protein
VETLYRKFKFLCCTALVQEYICYSQGFSLSVNAGVQGLQVHDNKRFVNNHTTKYTINGNSISIFLRKELMLFIVPDNYAVTYGTLRISVPCIGVILYLRIVDSLTLIMFILCTIR